jgi:calcium-dependent protein kinase
VHGVEESALVSAELDLKQLVVSFTRPSAGQALKHPWLMEQLGLEEKELKSSAISHKSVRTGEFANYLAMKKLKKATLGYIASNLTQGEVSTLEGIFNSMDQNHDGNISLKELDDAIAQGNFSENVLHDLRQLRTDLAISGDQQLNWRDFLASTMDRSLALREDNMKRAFEHFRHTDAEYLTIDDLAEILGGTAQAREVMSAVFHKDGKVSFEDFRRAFSEIMDTEEKTEVADESSNHDNIS